MVGKKQKFGHLWKILRDAIGFEDSTPVLFQVYVGRTQRESAFEHRAVQTEANPLRRLTTAELTSDTQNTNTTGMSLGGRPRSHLLPGPPQRGAVFT